MSLSRSHALFVLYLLLLLSPLLLLWLLGALPAEPLRPLQAQEPEDQYVVFVPRLEARQSAPEQASSTPAIALTLGSTSTATMAATVLPSASSTVAADGSPTPTAAATTSEIPTETITPSPGPPPSPSPSATPTATSETQSPPWLEMLNEHRDRAKLPKVTENREWNEGLALHARYMVKTDEIVHRENSESPWFTPEGNAAGQNGNVYVSANPESPSQRAMDWWMSAPFHAIALLDPELRQSAYGEHREAIGRWQFGATIDIGRGKSKEGPMPHFPLVYPAPDALIPLLSFGGGEWPDPLPSCPSYTLPTGPPIYLMLGKGDQVPELRSSFLFVAGGGQLPHCVFDETSFKHPNESERDAGRSILNGRDAIVILPKAPLRPATEYRVTIDANEAVTSWTFKTAPSALSRQGPKNDMGASR